MLIIYSSIPNYSPIKIQNRRQRSTNFAPSYTPWRTIREKIRRESQSLKTNIKTEPLSRNPNNAHSRLAGQAPHRRLMACFCERLTSLRLKGFGIDISAALSLLLNELNQLTSSGPPLYRCWYKLIKGIIDT